MPVWAIFVNSMLFTVSAGFGAARWASFTVYGDGSNHVVVITVVGSIDLWVGNGALSKNRINKIKMGAWVGRPSGEGGRGGGGKGGRGEGGEGEERRGEGV